jgi:hypothetical protein
MTNMDANHMTRRRGLANGGADYAESPAIVRVESCVLRRWVIRPSAGLGERNYFISKSASSPLANLPY